MTPEEINRALQLAYDNGFKDGSAAEREACALQLEAEADRLDKIGYFDEPGFVRSLAAAIRRHT